MDEKTAPIGPPAQPSPDAPTQERYGHVLIQRKLGQGAMGEVLLGFHEGFQTGVAVKLLPTNFKEGERVDRFLREAQIAVRLDHPNIIRVFDVGREHGRVYMIMEYVEGQDLEAYAQDRGGRLPVTEALGLIGQAARGLAHAHGEGVMHRDIKPSNLIRRAADGRVKVLDFGIARARAMDQITQTDILVGSLPFMSYEQLLGHPTSASDVYALGVSLYKLLAGRLPFQGGIEEAMQYHREGSPAPLSTHRPTPERVQALVSRMLARESSQRPSAAEAADEIDRLLADLGVPPLAAEEPARFSSSVANIAADMLGDSTPSSPLQGHGVDVPPGATAATQPLAGTPPRGGRRSAAILVVCGVLLAFGSWRLWPRGVVPPSPTLGGAPQGLFAELAIWIRPVVIRSFAKAEMTRAEVPPSGRIIHSLEGLRFAIGSQVPRHVYVFAVDTDGEAACLYPDFFEAQFAQEKRDGKVEGDPPHEPLGTDGGTIFVPPMVRAAGGSIVAHWFTADASVGKEWFLIAASEAPIPELEAIRKSPDLAKRGGEIKALGVQWSQEMKAPSSAAAPSTPQHFPEERLGALDLQSAHGPARVVWTLTLDHQK